jgi:hypothetical protein
VRVAYAEILDQTEVRQVRVLVGCEEHVRRLHVTVYELPGMRRVQRRCDLGNDVSGARRSQRTVLGDH